MAQTNSARRGHKHTLASLLSDTLVAGDILYVNASGVLVSLPKGSDTEILTLASGLPSWAAAGGGGATQLSELSDVTTVAYTARHVLVADGVDYDSRLLVEADISDLGSYEPVDATLVRDDDVGYNNTDWDTAFGWGDHASGGYEAADADIAKTDVDDVVTAHWSVPSTINTQNANYTAVLGDAGKTIRKASGGAGETITIPANSSVAYPVGTFLAFDNEGGGALTIAITTDTLIWADDGTTGSRTLADSGYAVAQKVATTTWKIAGKQLT